MSQVLKVPILLRGKKPHHFRYIDKEYFIVKIARLGIVSVRQYIKWHKDCKPGGFPLHPERVYACRWSDLLKSDNKYLADLEYAVRAINLVPYWEAVNLVQPLKLSTKREYLVAFDEGRIPDGIPRQPHIRYTLFTKSGGWSAFLGKKAKDKILAAKHVQPLLVLYYSSEHNSNIISIIIHRTGLSTLRKELIKKNIHVLKIFNWYNDFGEHVFELMDRIGNKQKDNTWIFPNIHDILWELSDVLEVANLDK